jgi:hypothetical protein
VKIALSIMAVIVLVSVAVVVMAITQYGKEAVNLPTMPETISIDEYMKGMQMDVSGYERDGKNFLIFTTNKGNMCVVEIE